MKTLAKEELKKMIDEGEEFELINVLGPEQFEAKRIPGSINIPVDKIEKKIEDKVPNKGRKIVVYCASFSCHASPTAAKKLEEMGYNNVYDYEGGIRDWEEAGYNLEGHLVN